MLAIRLPEDIEKRLDDLEDICLAGQRLAEIRAGRVETLTLEDVIKKHGLAD
jgi:RHH-type rel operon transcriptional repressor/antitoxin RelB